MRVRATLLILSALITGNALATDAERFARELNWEAKWQRVIDRSTNKYIARIESRRLAEIPSARRSKAIAELRKYFDAKLGWKTTGRDFTGNMIVSCDAGVLETLVKLKKKRPVTSNEKKQALTAYRQCATTGYKQSMKSLRKRIPTLMKGVNSIIAKYD